MSLVRLPCLKWSSLRFMISFILQQDKVLDATHMSKGYMVSIKVVPTSDEINIAQLLSSEELRNRADNHCVPVLDVLPDPLDDSSVLLVVPYLRPFEDPPFEIVDAIMDFIHQTLEVSQQLDL